MTFAIAWLAVSIVAGINIGRTIRNADARENTADDLPEWLGIGSDGFSHDNLNSAQEAHDHVA